MTDVGKALRDKLSAAVDSVAPKTVFEKQSADGTHKWLLGMDGSNAIETVFIPETSRGTLCVSSQVGCGLNCQFCSTATQGFNRNLSDRRDHRPGLGRGTPSRQCAAPSAQAHQRRHDGHGRAAAEFRQRRARDERHARRSGSSGLANKRVTLSTAGLVPMIDRLSEESDVSLAVSLHAPNDELRTELVPLNKKYPIAELLGACQRYVAKTAACVDHVRIHDDEEVSTTSPNMARQLVKLMRKVPSKVNLIPFNPFTGTRFERSDESRDPRSSRRSCSIRTS